MRTFQKPTTQSLLRVLRRNIHLYIFVRRFAVPLSRWFYLEQGFDILKHISPQHDAVALDIGSNDGTSINLIRKSQPLIFIHSFDPIFKLEKNFKLHAFHHYGLSSEIGIQDFFVPNVAGYELKQYASAHRAKIVSQIDQDFGRKENQIVFRKIRKRIVTLDSLRFKPFFIKIDVEGHEIHVLKGAENTLKMFKPIVLIEIATHKSYEDVLGFLADIGYVLLEWPPIRRRSSVKSTFKYSNRQVNYVWIPSDSSNTWSFLESKDKKTHAQFWIQKLFTSSVKSAR